MKTSTMQILTELVERYPSLATVKEEIKQAFSLMKEAYEKDAKLLVCGNGGSAADAEHIVGELMKCFRKKRPIDQELYNALGAFGEEGAKLQQTLEGGLRAFALTSHIALSTAFANDREPSVCFAQQLCGMAEKDDLLLTISTSGNAENCVLAAITAKAMGLHVVALTGQKESRLSNVADLTIRVPQTETYKIQELHLPVYHCLCAMLEEELF